MITIRNYKTNSCFAKAKDLKFTHSLHNTSSSLLNPWFITGFVDAEGCFLISVLKNKELKTKWGVRASFKINLHKKDKALLEQIKSVFGVGKIYTAGPNNYSYEVHTIKELEVIIAHFDKYPLISNKSSDFKLFKLVVSYMKKGEHLTMEGLEKIISIKSSMNRGLSNVLNKAFPDIDPTDRPEIKDQTIKDPHWIAGFTSGEGSFMVRVKNSTTNRTGSQVELVFQITQHIRDKLLLISLIDYFGCGRYRERAGGLAGDFVVNKSSDFIEKIIPFFETYRIVGEKSKDYEDFKQVANLVKSSAHLTIEGVEQIKQIQAGMNTKRLNQ